MTEIPDYAQGLPYRLCVGIALVNASGYLWAGQRVDNTSDAWQMPQGGIDPGEDPLAASYRELWEETGIAQDNVQKLAEVDDWLTYDLPKELLGTIWKGKYRGQRQKWFIYRYLGGDEQIVIVRKNQEFRTWKWIGGAELLAAVVPFKRDVYRRVLNEFAQYIVD